MKKATVTTREFVIGDFEPALALWKRMEEIEICEGDSAEEIRSFLERNLGLSRVAEVNGEMVGAALCGHDGRRGWIYHLAVSDAYRGMGIGTSLMEECCRGLRNAGIRRAIILVSGDNAPGREFWVRSGWEDISKAIPMGRDL